MRVGQADRQLDLDEGRRGAVPRACAQVPVVWRRGRRHGVRRGRPGRHAASARSRSASAPTSCSSPTAPTPTTSSSIPNIFAVATGIDEHRRYAHRLHRGGEGDPPPLPGHAHLRRPVEPQLLIPRQRARAPRDAQRVPLPRDPRGHGHGHRQCRPARRLRRDRSRASRGLRGRHPRPPRGCDRAADRARREVSREPTKPRRRSSPNGARCPSASGCPTRWSRASTRTSSTTPRKRGSSSPRRRSR